MNIVDVAILEARFSEFLALAKIGGEVLVTEHGRPIAKIVPVGDDGLVLEDLERAGVMKRPIRNLDETFWQLARGIDNQSAVRAALVAERETNW